jgi:hypothetical protein
VNLQPWTSDQAADAFNTAVESEIRAEGIDRLEAELRVIERAKRDRDNERESQCD